MTTTATRIWTFATVIVVIVVVALGWFLGVSPQLSSAAQAETDRQAVVAQNVALQATTDALAADFAAIGDLRDQLAEVQAEFPAYAAYDDFSEFLLGALGSAGVTLGSVQVAFSVPTSVDVVPDEAGQVAAGTLLRVPVSITVDGEFANALLFIQALQLSDRFTFVNVAAFTGGSTGAPSTVVSVVYYVVSEAPVVVDDPLAGGVEVEPTEPEPTPTPAPSD